MIMLLISENGHLHTGKYGKHLEKYQTLVGAQAGAGAKHQAKRRPEPISLPELAFSDI